MFKVIEVRFDELTGNESEHILLKTRFKSRADQKCKDANGKFENQVPGFESFAVVVDIHPDKNPMWGGRLPGDPVFKA